MTVSLELFGVLVNLVPTAFPSKNPFFEGKALGTRLVCLCLRLSQFLLIGGLVPAEIHFWRLQDMSLVGGSSTEALPG